MHNLSGPSVQHPPIRAMRLGCRRGAITTSSPKNFLMVVFVLRIYHEMKRDLKLVQIWGALYKRAGTPVISNVHENNDLHFGNTDTFNRHLTSSECSMMHCAETTLLRCFQVRFHYSNDLLALLLCNKSFYWLRVRFQPSSPRVEV